MEKEEPDKVSAFKIMLYYATGAALLVIPDWLPVKCNDKSTARHQENGRCHMAGNRSGSPSWEPVVPPKDFTDILLKFPPPPHISYLSNSFLRWAV
ncbi:hypothetical protein [Phocaeicola vulgatus]|uniref:hypothetical protein n=1 Tax=Phocaeicola vulgatus TaxID=821 RepID=UPI001E463852|nr:hypothetical protein [Phocaeicola vulgatus]